MKLKYLSACSGLMKGQLIMNTLLALKFDVQYKSLWPHVAIEHLRCFGLTGVVLCALDACGTLEAMKKNVEYAVHDF